ncbi:TolC family protein [Thioalkalivibrio sp.]|uniref:TolC family protein n=1 Tax=Thioalkalivibrio sp. TaxID=2093813 RepID=UPI0025CC4B0C|nr:TolC family protein [Thioalkalivibrio sp.]
MKTALLQTVSAAFGLAMLLVSASPAAHEPAHDRLSLEDALSRAQAENPELLISRARIARAEAVRRQTLQGVLPTLSVDASYLRLDTSLLDDIPVLEPGFPPVLTRQDLGPVDARIATVQVVQPLINVGAWNARRQAEFKTDAARSVLRRTRDEVALAVIETYFGARTAERRVEAELRGLATAERALRQAQAGFDEGLIPPVDVLRARSRVLEMEARVATAESQVVAAHALLRQVLGIEGQGMLQLTDAVPEPPRTLPPEPSESEILARRNDLQALQETVSAARFGVQRSRSAYVPDVNLLLRYQHVETDRPLDLAESGWLVGVNLRWTPFAGLGQAGAVDEARAVAQEADAELRALRLLARGEVQEARADWEAELLGWDRASSGVDDAEAALSLTEARYAEGLDDMTSLLQAQAEELGAVTREINARFNTLVAAQRYRLAIEAGDPTAISP